MKYKIQQLDKRHSYHYLFRYYIGFPTSMSQGLGPLEFTRATKWFTETYGWSAEIQMYDKIMDWVHLGQRKQGFASMVANSQIKEKPPECNPHWSWTNGVGSEYRIYVASDSELSFFCLKYPVDR